jgi:hypothetical protein
MRLSLSYTGFLTGGLFRPWTRSPEPDVNGGDHRAGSRQSHTNHPARTGIYMYALQYVNVNYNHIFDNNRKDSNKVQTKKVLVLK